MANESMKERVMRALTEVIADRIPNNRSALDAVGCSYEMAHAAIEAMREPTQEMVDAGRKGMERNEFRDGWDAALDIALYGA